MEELCGNKGRLGRDAAGFADKWAGYKASSQDCWTAFAHTCECVCAKVQPPAPQEGQTHNKPKSVDVLQHGTKSGRLLKPTTLSLKKEDHTGHNRGSGAAATTHSPVSGAAAAAAMCAALYACVTP